MEPTATTWVSNFVISTYAHYRACGFSKRGTYDTIMQGLSYVATHAAHLPKGSRETAAAANSHTSLDDILRAAQRHECPDDLAERLALLSPSLYRDEGLAYLIGSEYFESGRFPLFDESLYARIEAERVRRRAFLGE